MENNNDSLSDYLEKLNAINENFSKTIGEEPEELEIEEQLKQISELGKVLGSLEGDIKKTAEARAHIVDVGIKLLHEKAVVPTYAKPGDAGMDLTITEIISITDEKVVYSYGIAVEIPEGYVGLVFPRSSISKIDLLMTNSVGCVDSGYRGPLMSVFYRYDEKYYQVGERGAQLLIIPYPKVNFIVKDELSETERNTGGYGHSGK